MSGFCVFGVNFADCKKKAEKKVDLHDKELKRNLTQEEWIAKVDAMARELFEKSSFRKQVSPPLRRSSVCHGVD